MKYSVLYTAFSDHQLADIWLRAAHRQKVTAAVAVLERSLRHNADQLGVLDSSGRRVLLAVPLTITFDVIPDDCKVVILSIRYNESLDKG